ncbi:MULTISPECIES: DUF805 domain-containing protein [unclassified Thiobacillus]|uniref:DUF805 domain-containing protein n=1 Tax=unclassified Thiobacillus TaxID=2646513 RepID=UPI00086A9B62|nr:MULTISPECIES: DUF805 domain-containing protein [unclassified Thiobacillus]MBN8778806.1 DUF805 domain-containing protein [Thiobacillus sp.]ODU86184.1 MAG: hypothetical protein ABT21_14725 [Thiobacillus sp. SCN 65-179]ODV01362.1 MAG: hypothetical protein ABT23_09095 [Thiobacillus sp. SCN 63-57]
MEWFIKVIKSFSFNGRARRKEYWFFFLFVIVIAFLLGLLDSLIGTYSKKTELGLLGGIFLLGILIQSIAVGVRRLHDTGRSGWWLLIGLIPFVGSIIVLILMLLAGQPGTNEYGPDPRQPN